MLPVCPPKDANPRAPPADAVSLGSHAVFLCPWPLTCPVHRATAALAGPVGDTAVSSWPQPGTAQRRWAEAGMEGDLGGFWKGAQGLLRCCSGPLREPRAACVDTEHDHREIRVEMREAGLGPCVNLLSSAAQAHERSIFCCSNIARCPALHITLCGSFWLWWGVFFFADESPGCAFCKQFLADSLEGKLCPWWKHPAEWEGHAPSQGSASFSSLAEPGQQK